MSAMALFSLYLYFFFTYFNIFFPTNQSQPRLDTTAETFFLPFFHAIFEVVPLFQTTAETFFQLFSDFLSLTVVLLLYKSEILTSETIMALSDGILHVFPPPWL